MGKAPVTGDSGPEDTVHGASQTLLKEVLPAPRQCPSHAPQKPRGGLGQGLRGKEALVSLRKTKHSLLVLGKPAPSRRKAREHDGAEGTGTEAPIVSTAHLLRHCPSSTSSSPTASLLALEEENNRHCGL